MPTVTLDTNVLPVDDLRAALEPRGFSFAVVSVSARETRGAWIAASVTPLTSIPENAVWDETEYGVGLYDAGGKDVQCLAASLTIISDGSFPAPDRRGSLSPGQRRQLRDAMILCAHVRERRNIFVTNDERGFVKRGRRERLQAAFDTRIMTREEFVTEFITGMHHRLE